MKISYTLPNVRRKELVTGGHFYDKMLTDEIANKTSHTINNLALNIGKWDKNLIIAPFLYLLKGLKERHTDIYIFNSVIFMRFMLLPFFLRKVRNKKLMAVHHHFMYRQLKGLKKWIYKTFEWNFLNQMDKIIVPSPYVYSDLQKVYPKDKLILLRIPFENEAKFTSIPIKGHLTFAGTIEYRKGLIFLLKALQILKERGKNYSLTIIGKVTEPKYYDSLKEYIEKYDLDVKFTGFISREEKDQYLAQSDVFVFPSLLEGYGMALVEAQVYGLPIVSFDNSAMPFNVKNDINGYTVPTFDIEAYADAIEKIVENRDLREKFSKGALENIKNQNTPDKFGKQIAEQFENLKF